MTLSRMKQEPEHFTGDSNGPSRPLSIASRSSALAQQPSISVSTTTNASQPATRRSSDTLPDDTMMSGYNVEPNGTGPHYHSTPRNASPFTQSPEHDLQHLGQQARQLIQTIQKLEALNIEATIASLPLFIVVGDQSAGKSSIIESICGITVPRDQGTCTRCPFKITTAAADPSQPWRCRITLLIDYAYDTSRLAGGDPFAYNHWVRQTATRKMDFATTTDSKELESILRRAQCAILNPNTHPQEFLQGPRAIDVKEASFSPNIVSLHIEGPDLPELSFVDLPGAINVVENGDDYLVATIKTLLSNYLRKERTLVLLACPADQDIENSTAFRYVKEQGAVSRCMGVLTKPDLVGPLRLPLIERVLAGRSFQLSSPDAWFVTKQLDQKALEQAISHDQARTHERQFFVGEPWATTLSAFAHRFGATNLQSAISKKLTQHILGELPSIIARVQHKLVEIDEQLLLFPAKPKSASMTVMNEIFRLVQDVREQINPNARHEFRKAYRDIFKAARKALDDTRPRIDLSTPAQAKRKRVETINLSSDDEPSVMHTPSKVIKGPNGSALRTPRHVSASPRPSPTPQSVRVKREVTRQTPRKIGPLRLDQVQSDYEGGSNSLLPGEVNNKITEQYCMSFIERWADTVDIHTSKAKQHVVKMLQSCVDTTLAAYQHTQFHTEASRAVCEFCAALVSEFDTFAKTMINCERGQRPKSFVAGSLHNRIESVRDVLNKSRTEKRLEERFERMEDDGLKVPSAAEKDKKYAELVATHLPGIDPYKKVIDNMGTAIAYYDFASDRVIDNVGLLFEDKVICALYDGLQDSLIASLRVDDEDAAVQLLAEDPQREMERLRLTTEKQKLRAALAELEGLPTSYEN